MRVKHLEYYYWDQAHLEEKIEKLYAKQEEVITSLNQLIWRLGLEEPDAERQEGQGSD